MSSPATMAAATRTTATGKVVVTGKPDPETKGKEVGTSNENNLTALADVALTDQAIITLVKTTLTYTSGQGKLLQNFQVAILEYVSGLEELVREFEKTMAELLKSYLAEK